MEACGPSGWINDLAVSLGLKTRVRSTNEDAGQWSNVKRKTVKGNSCDYRLAAHSTIGKMVGLTEEQILDSRHGKAIDSKTDAVLRLAGLLVDNRGQVSDRELEEARTAGLNDATIAEIVATVALNIFTNYFNHVADPEIDFPKAAPLSLEAEACNVVEACCSSHKYLGCGHSSGRTFKTHFRGSHEFNIHHLSAL
jgi:alkylhydroperoxidase family enzyme